ncbi:phosphoenolpyruvate kinase [Candidatus Acetothermia bacterium]|nr:phosphoenolpyruvate kinase [Candidatus Acetothermia bacterium]
MKTSLSHGSVQKIAARLQQANTAFTQRYPGESGRRQPVHTVYGGAHLFKSGTAQRLGAMARQAFAEYAPNFVTLAKAVDLPGSETLPDKPSQISELATRLSKTPDTVKRENYPAWFAHAVYSRVQEKLNREPVEDFRIDFEDGYGNRPDTEEDGHAVAAASEVAKGMRENTLPPFIGIRIKPFTEELKARSIRTLDLFVTALLEQTSGHLPANFVITLPKVVMPEQVAALADLFDLFEKQTGLARDTLRMEMMIETTQAIINERGETNLPRLLDAARGRCVAAHFGTYDYTASYSITAAYQHMMHPACDFAKHMMKVAFAGTGLWLSDGATNIMPIAPHRASEGKPLTPEQISANRAVVHQAWKLHYDHIRHSLINAFYQGWDLHPAQLPTRYTAVYSFFLENLDAASERLRNFVAKAAQATLVGDVFDDAATGQGLLNYFLRAINCGAITEEEAGALTSLTLEELRSRSFVSILKKRQK